MLLSVIKVVIFVCLELGGGTWGGGDTPVHQHHCDVFCVIEVYLQFYEQKIQENKVVKGKKSLNLVCSILFMTFRFIFQLHLFEPNLWKHSQSTQRIAHTWGVIRWGRGNHRSRGIHHWHRVRRWGERQGPGIFLWLLFAQAYSWEVQVRVCLHGWECWGTRVIHLQRISFRWNASRMLRSNVQYGWKSLRCLNYMHFLS